MPVFGVLGYYPDAPGCAGKLLVKLVSGYAPGYHPSVRLKTLSPVWKALRRFLPRERSSLPRLVRVGVRVRVRAYPNPNPNPNHNLTLTLTLTLT